MADTVREYGKALYELSCEEGLESEFLGELRVVSGIIAENPGFITLLSAPNIPKSERMQVIDNAFSGRIHEYICSFMKLMTKRGHSRYILPCFREYERLWYEYSGIAVARRDHSRPADSGGKERSSRKARGLYRKSGRNALSCRSRAYRRRFGNG